MMRSYLLAGFLAALSDQTNGLDATSVQFGTAPDSYSQSWEFNTEGFANDEDVITRVDSSKPLLCERGSPCQLDPEGSSIPFRVV
ncbi:uncharacterized protein N7529_004702 [Penicillium soppii]|uniref:uncharacterized protein n=1 Tax=Penicillium soppii TaxID=69789 RepID=UPI0025482ECB|nr:uncharacterized protein N7529_004702 [Penicillium soppii]KAJ5872349.1 hypothetical protein N7529_004702 [Penicillium soppii]